MTTPTNEAGHGLPELPEPDAYCAPHAPIGSRAFSWAGDQPEGAIPLYCERKLISFAKDYAAALALSRGVPADMVLVPREPTPEMQRAYFDSIDKHLDAVAKSPFFGRHDNHRVAYRAMLAAAPAAAGAQGEVPNVSDVLLKTDDPIQQMRMVVQVARENDSLISRKWVEGWADQWERERHLTTPQPGAADGAQGEEYPECSGDPSACPENEGYGCCKPNPKCSCPSGDGSLRWPCAVHQPAAADGGVRERARELSDMIDRYWNLAYAEGKEGRDHDTDNGDAALCRYEIEKHLRALSSHRQVGGESKFRELAGEWRRVAEKFHEMGSSISIAEGAVMRNLATELESLLALVEKGAGS